MTRYSLESRRRRYVKGYGFLSFTKNIGKRALKAGKEIGKSGLVKTAIKSAGKKAIDAGKELARSDTFKKAVKSVGEKAVSQAADAAGDFIGSKIAYKLADQSKNCLVFVL